MTRLSVFLLGYLAVIPRPGAFALDHTSEPPNLRRLPIQDKHNRTKPLQDVVTWDSNSLFIRGNRIMIFSGEFHPFRLPVPSLWMDVFEKVKALGLNTVSFYADWALLEGTPGEFRSDGIFNYTAFFAAAKEAGIYLIARPGPYIST